MKLENSAAWSHESSRDRSNQLPTAALRISSTSKEREDLLETAKVFNRPTESRSRDAKKNTDVHVIGKVADPDDEWSPLDPEGEKQYDRDFLLQLQGHPMSLCKPTNLPNLDALKDKKLTEVNRVVPQKIPQIRTYNDPFMPNYVRGDAFRLPRPAVNRRSQQGWGEKPRKIISFTSSLTQNIKLHESENARKPLNKLSLTDIAQEDLEREKLKRSVQGVLNKLTLQKCETLLTQVKGKTLNTEEKLDVVIDLIFKKAIDEPHFSVPYANLCRHLALIKVPLADQTEGQVSFLKLLLTKCQKEFEEDRDELKHVEWMKALEEAEPDEQKEMKLEFDLEEKKMRYRQLSNIRFIGELFKLGMVMEPFMHECIKKLLSQGDEKSLECLCQLLKRIGKELDETKGGKSRDHSPMDMYFAQMQKCVDKRLTSCRVRFMLEDVIDLKKKLEFTLSQTEVKPNARMTIEEIKKKILSLLEKNEANKTVIDWNDANVSGNDEPTFIRALVSAVHEHVISGSGATCELAVAQLKERMELLTRYINHNEKLELQALYAIQTLTNQLGQPNGLLRQIFEILYDDDVITEETFKAWESSTDPNESEGKGVAVHSVKAFFNWLRESESGEEAD